MDYPIMSHNAAPTVSGTSISNTNKVVDGSSLWYETATAIGPPVPPTTTGSITSNQVTLCRIKPSVNKTITHISFIVQSAAANNDSCDVGIYTIDSGTALTLQRSSGATSAQINQSFSIRTIALSSGYAITAGTAYYLGFVATLTGGSPQISVITNGGVTVPGMFLSTAANTRTEQWGIYYAHNAGTLPATITTGLNNFGSVPYLVARTQA